MDVVCKNDFCFNISEETLGWFQFLEKTKAQFKQIPRHWEIDISVPVFELTPTLIYDIQERSLEDFLNDEYPKTKKSYLLRLIDLIRGWF